jgi:hypothetical protein
MNLSRLLVVACLLLTSSVRAQVFSWPVDSPSVSQQYSCRKCIASGMSSRYYEGVNMHTGVDMKPSNYPGGYTTSVRAAADGTVVQVVPEASAHGMGNVVVVAHANGLYTLYGHLHSFAASTYVGANVYRGQQLGIMGDTGVVTGPHVHFEVKDRNALGILTTNTSYYGYMPGHPDNYGYHDPRLVVAGTAEEALTNQVVVNPPPGALNVRNAPGTIYSGSTGTMLIDKIGENQKYTATKRVWYEGRNWYFIQLPSQNSPIEGPENQGPFGGWVADLAQPTFAGQVESTTDGLRIRSAASTAYATLGKVYYQQRFARVGPSTYGSGCAQPWYQVYVPGDAGVEFAGAGTGWICGDYLTLIP